MAKRHVRRAPRPRRPQPPVRSLPRADATPVQPAAAPAVAARTAPADLQDEYRYVIGDLKRIAIVAASMFALLAVLALIIT